MKSERKMHIELGVPREITPDEHRVALAPSGVKIITEQGHRVLVERDAGAHCNFTNQEYSEAGAEIVDDVKELYKLSNVVVKVAPPLPEEYDLLQRNQVIISALHLGSVRQEYVETVLKKV